MARQRKAHSIARIAFTPSPKAREFFDQLVHRLTKERGIDVRVTQREAFDYLVELARHGEKSQQFFRPPLAEIRRPDGRQS